MRYCLLPTSLNTWPPITTEFFFFIPYSLYRTCIGYFLKHISDIMLAYMQVSYCRLRCQKNNLYMPDSPPEENLCLLIIHTAIVRSESSCMGWKATCLSFVPREEGTCGALITSTACLVKQYSLVTLLPYSSLWSLPPNLFLVLLPDPFVFVCKQRFLLPHQANHTSYYPPEIDLALSVCPTHVSLCTQ